jgi:hypothetical protein
MVGSMERRGRVVDHAAWNVVVEWSTLLLRIREVLGSNISPETGYLA